MPPQYIPQLDGKVDPAVARAIRDLFLKQYQLEQAQQAQLLKRSPAPSGSQNFLSKISALPGFSFLQTGSSTFISNTQGSIPPIVMGSLLYDNATANVVKWYSVGLALLLANRGIINVVDTSAVNPIISVAGLAPAAYFFYPKYNVRLRAVQFSTVAGGVGAPAAAYAARNSLAAIDQSSDGFINLSPGGITGIASGGGGAGGGGGGSGCPRQNMIVRELTKGLIRAGEVERFDIIATRRGIGWTMATYSGLIPCREWSRIETDNAAIEQSPDTPMWTADGRSIISRDVKSGLDYVNTFQGKMKANASTFKQLDYKVLMRCWPHAEFLCGEGYPGIETHNGINPK